MSDRLQELAQLWRERYARRARGGTVSLEGYRYQLLVALRDAVRAFVDGQTDAPSVFVETVSAICQRQPDGEVLFTQVKWAGRTVGGALEELWALHTLVLAHLPDLLPKLKYRILCARWTLQDVQGAMDRWRPAGAVEPDQLASFKSRIAAATDPNPMDELLDLVANRLSAERPLPTVLSWLGRLTDLPGGARDFWSELCTLRNQGRARENRPTYL